MLAAHCGLCELGAGCGGQGEAVCYAGTPLHFVFVKCVCSVIRSPAPLPGSASAKRAPGSLRHVFSQQRGTLVGF